MTWKTIERPGFFGKNRDGAFNQYNEKYGEGNWRLRWTWKGKDISYKSACLVYEASYYKDSFTREDLWKELISKAKDVYDHQESNVNSGLDYLLQEGGSTHIQDIAIRRVVLHRGWNFEGDELIQIRSHKTYWGNNLSPGKVPFHLPELIISPHLESWWDKNSVEDYYQSNKVLEIKEK